MARRIFTTTLLVAVFAAIPGTAATPPPTETPQDAVAAVKRVLKRSLTGCRTDWARIDAVGYEGSWTVEVRIRDSKAGKGTAVWFIGDGWPRAKNALAKAIAHGCPAD